MADPQKVLSGDRANNHGKDPEKLQYIAKYRDILSDLLMSYVDKGDDLFREEQSWVTPLTTLSLMTNRY